MEAKRLCSDRISNLPPSIIETILYLLPTEEAARTSILSTEWRYHWTKIPKLVFIEYARKNTLERFRNPLIISSKLNGELFCAAINKAMSMHQCPIHEFSLTTYAHGSCVEVDHIIDHLSRNNNTVKKLTLDMYGYRIPETLFSLHKLTDLYLNHCRLDVQPTFSGFSSLADLCMENVKITKQMLLLFLSGCPLLKTVILNPDLGSLRDNDDSTLIQLFECLPVIETLSFHLFMMKYYDQGRVPNNLRAALVHLKRLCIIDSLFAYKYRFPCYVFLIRSSPNLEKLKMMICYDLRMSEKQFITWDNYSDLWLEHLKELEIEFSTRIGQVTCAEKGEDTASPQGF